MWKRVSAAVLMLGICSNAHALTVASWQVDAKPDKDNDCTMQHTYKDKDDNNAENTVVLLFSNDKAGKPLMAITFGYEKWTYTKGDKLKADLLVGDTVEQRNAEWEVSDPAVITGLFRDGDDLLQSIAHDKTLTLRFDGDKDRYARFNVPDIAQAIGAATVCRSLLK